jgi:hypothetical protein
MCARFRVLTGLAVLALAVPVGASARSVVSGATHRPESVGQCFQTRVRNVGTRLVEGDGRAVPGSGSEIELEDGHVNTDYDQLPGIDRSRPGDPVELCVIFVPRHCPRGDTRGIRYHGHNLRTGLSWRAMDAEHMCGGA